MRPKVVYRGRHRFGSSSDNARPPSVLEYRRGERGHRTRADGSPKRAEHTSEEGNLNWTLREEPDDYEGEGEGGDIGEGLSNQSENDPDD
jgi:hypothetical protein